MQTSGAERDQLKIIWNMILYLLMMFDVFLIMELYTTIIQPDPSSCCKAETGGTSQIFLLEKQIEQIGEKHLGDLEDIRAELEVIDEDSSGAEVKRMVVHQLTEAALKLDNDILDYSKEFENKSLKRIRFLLKVFRVNIKKLANFDLHKYGGKNFIKFCLKKVDQIIEILDKEDRLELSSL